MCKKLLVAICFFSATQLPSKLCAQTSLSSRVFKEWTMLAESPNMVDVFYKVLTCNNKNQIHLTVLNESPKDQVVQFDLEISNPAGEKISKKISLDLPQGRSSRAECTLEETLNNLKIDLPDNFYPYTVKLKVIFN